MHFYGFCFSRIHFVERGYSTKMSNAQLNTVKLGIGSYNLLDTETLYWIYLWFFSFFSGHLKWNSTRHKKKNSKMLVNDVLRLEWTASHVNRMSLTDTTWEWKVDGKHSLYIKHKFIPNIDYFIQYEFVLPEGWNTHSNTDKLNMRWKNAHSMCHTWGLLFVWPRFIFELNRNKTNVDIPMRKRERERVTEKTKKKQRHRQRDRVRERNTVDTSRYINIGRESHTTDHSWTYSKAFVFILLTFSRCRAKEWCSISNCFSGVNNNIISIPKNKQLVPPSNRS